MPTLQLTQSEIYCIRDAMKSHMVEMDKLFPSGNIYREEIIGEIGDIQDKLSKQVKEEQEISDAIRYLKELSYTKNNQSLTNGVADT